MKAGTVAIIGKPNAGKSTLLNAILGRKVAITSPKPQTTRFQIDAIYEDDRGQILFIDTPGLLEKVEDPVGRHINVRAHDIINRQTDAVIYIVDHTKERGAEESKTLGLVRKFTCPKILVINKIDMKTPTHIVQYKFMEDEFNATVYVSALRRTHIKQLLEVVFSFLPEGPPLVDTAHIPQPGISLDSMTFISEIIREKAFLFLRKEVPYSLTAVVDDISERENGTMYIKARILTTKDKYKSMIIGKNGAMIKEISMAARKELEIATNKKIYLEIVVEVNPDWFNSI